MYWPGLTEDVKEHVKKCLPCQMCKKTQKPYGHLPPKEAEVEPWQEVHVDLVGPWTVKTPTGVKKLQAFTAIDPATGWFEVVDIKDKSAGTVMDAFHEQWLCRYPRPKKVVFDNGSEFKSVFKEMCTNLSIVCKPTTSYNPQGNVIVERILQVMGNMLRSFELEDRELDQDNPWSEFLQACAFGI
jgi:transposase InsO family protein